VFVSRIVEDTRGDDGPKQDAAAGEASLTAASATRLPDVRTYLGAQGFVFPEVSQPDVSIVVVTYQGAKWIGRALDALLENTEPRYEVIVVDNGSTDSTTAILAQVENATLVFNERNYGFGIGNNQGAAHARARHLLFLNQDVFVHPGWLEPLLERIDSDEGIGAVGPMLLNLDGSLQCAGAGVSRSGATVCYGEGDDPRRSEYRFPRVVDYLAGACLLVRRRAFEEVRGFDPAYGLAYFEDTDLCFALAAQGYRSLYEPSSVATHVRGIPGEALLRVAERNRTFFERRWRGVLASRPSLPSHAAVSVDSVVA
jgi:GT2 family glycosyltransferase